MLNIFLASTSGVQLDERTRKVLLVLAALFILLLLIMGGIYALIDAYMKKEAKRLDTYMYDLLKTRIVKKPSQFIAAVNYYEERSLYKNSVGGWWLLILATLAIVGISYIIADGHHLQYVTEIGLLFPNVSWQTTGQYNENLRELLLETGRILEYEAMKLQGPEFLPASVFPTFTVKEGLAEAFQGITLYISIIYWVLSLIALFIITKAILGYVARTFRGAKMSKKVFQKNLDTINLDTICDLTSQQSEANFLKESQN